MWGALLSTCVNFSLSGSLPDKLELQAKELQATSQIDCVEICWYHNNIRTFQLCLQLAACSLQLRAISYILVEKRERLCYYINV